jgi:predicted AAA+ superfamily ATPase
LYLKEEIQAEALTRSLPSFSRFLKLAALASSEQINYSNIASDVGLSAKTIKEHYEILHDTLLGFSLPVWRSGKKRKTSATSKYYMFDLGVIHTLAGTKTLDRNSDLYEKSFEHFIIGEVRAYQSYSKNRRELSYWRTVGGQEVDLVIGDDIAIEIKATSKISLRDLQGLIQIEEEAEWKERILISQDSLNQVRQGITCLHWQTFFERLWSHKY